MFQLTEDDYAIMSEDNGGFCTECGEEAYGVEPDARGYKCEACGAMKVYGIEELLIMGQVEFVSED
ncbi:MAG: hypothetical protein DWQ19_08780 [Crenarchaeota archaeon]|nr:MAG: hypothetical protein DWQ19_08780 [Thermoproteota archaeon]